MKKAFDLDAKSITLNCHSEGFSPKESSLFSTSARLLRINPRNDDLLKEKKMRKKYAFTLAEILITLGIIGIVAALTIPTLIQKHQERVTVNKLKKAYSIINQAYLRAQEEHGDLNNWSFLENSSGSLDQNTLDNIKIFWSNLIPYMELTSKCLENDTKNCIGNKKYDYYYLNGKIKNSTVSRLRLKDGTFFMGVWFGNINCTSGSCGDFSVDINGYAKPNTVGKDVFYFQIYRNRILPFGTTQKEFNDRCINGGDGYGCTAWVLFNGNLDYLHCPDKLGWDKARSCK